ncbi:hypothetical protein STAFG_2494 [Streptomyces afghaniensis 772]|uniref:Uncharacterized protein n=1 Tax=Streptomyces afghaniensis 772 TaxID=1283301 RepID=S4NPW7_9ACTN|nr:hypothetical protein STAFG_2494 [Streptomyces afghaniensis 772]
MPSIRPPGGTGRHAGVVLWHPVRGRPARGPPTARRTPDRVSPARRNGLSTGAGPRGGGVLEGKVPCQGTGKETDGVPFPGSRPTAETTADVQRRETDR